MGSTSPGISPAISDKSSVTGGWTHHSQSSSVKSARQSPQKGFLSTLTQPARSGNISSGFSLSCTFFLQQQHVIVIGEAISSSIPSHWHNARIVQANLGITMPSASALHQPCTRKSLYISLPLTYISLRGKILVNYSVYPPNWYLDYPVWMGLGRTPGEFVARLPGHQRN